MSVKIIRENGEFHTNCLFSSEAAAFSYLEGNTGLFNPNEVICLLDMNRRDATFYKMQLSVEVIPYVR